MKEQWKKLDSDAKLLLNVEEGRAVPIKIELPISAFASSQPNCCRGLITTLRISVLLLALLLLGWTGETLYSSYFYNGEIGEFVHNEPLIDSEENKQMFRQKVFEYESQKKNFDIHESNDVGSPESNNIEVTSEESLSKEASYSADSESTSESSEALKQVYPNDSEKEPEEEKQPQVEPVSEDRDVAEEKKSEEKSYDKPVRTFYNQIDSVAMDGGEIDENIIDQLLHNIHQMQSGNSIENLDGSIEHDRQWIDVSEAEREIEELEKQAQKELEEEVNKVLGEIFENAATSVLDELMKDDSKSDENQSTSDSEEGKVESGERNNFVNTDETSENKSQDAVDSIKSEPEIAVEQVPRSSEETNSEEDIHRGFWKMFTEEANKDKSIADKKFRDNDEIENSEGTPEAPEVAPVVARKVEPEDVMAIVAKKLEPIVGENQELLLWYLANKDKPIFETANDPLKVNTAKMLYSTNVREYGKDSSAVINLIADEYYEKEFEKLTNPAYEKIQPETKVQQEIVFRLQEKSNIFKKLSEEASSFEESLFTELIEAYNAIDEATAHQAIEEINDRAKEEESTEEAADNYFLVNENKDDNEANEATKEPSEPIIDNGNDSSLQSLLQAMRNVGTFEDKSEGTELQDPINYNRPVYRISEPRQYFSDEDVLGTYDPLLAEREEPILDSTYHQYLHEILQNIMEESKIENNDSDEVQEEHDNQDIHEKLEEDSKDADEEEKSSQAEQQEESSKTDSDTTQEMTKDASQNVADKFYRDLLEGLKIELMPKGIYTSDEDFYTSVIGTLHRMAKTRQNIDMSMGDFIDAIEESNKSHQALKNEDQAEQDNQDIQQELEEDSKDTDEEEKSSQAEHQDALSETDSDTTQEITTNASYNILDLSYRNLLKLLKNEYKTDLVPEGLYASDEDFFTSVIPILYRTAEKRQNGAMSIGDFIDAIEESNKSREALKDEGQVYLVSQFKQDVQNSEEIQSDQLNQEEAEIQPDQSNQEEAEVQPDQSNQEEAEVQLDQSNQEETEIQPNPSNQEEAEVQPDQSNQEEAEVQPDQSNEEEAEVQPDQSNQEETEVQQDQSNQEEAEVQPDHSNQEEAEVQPDQSNEEEAEVQQDQSNQEESELQPDQSNQEEAEVQQDQPNQEEAEEQPSMNEFLSFYGGGDEYDY